MTIKIATLISAIAILGITSCAKDQLDQGNSAEEEGKRVTVELSIKIPSATKPQTLQSRVTAVNERFSVAFSEESTSFLTRSTGTTELYNLWLFQFSNTGSIHGQPQKVTDAVHMVNDMALLSATLHVGTDQTLYLVALGKKVTPSIELATVSTLSELENISLDYLENRGGLYHCRITDESEVPFGGKASGVTVRELSNGSGEIVYGTPDGFAGGIEVKRLVARIQLKHKLDLSTHTLEGLKLLKVPTKLFINPASVASEVIEAVPMVDLENDNVFDQANKDENGFFTSQWYVAQNKRGTVAGINTELDRYRKVSDGSGPAPELGTNIEAWSYSNTSRSQYTIHQIYVGNNNTDNFDVEINSYYNLRTVINSSDLADARIRSYTAQQKVYLSSVAAYGSGGGATPSFFDAHYGSRPVIIYAQGRKVSVNIYTDIACTQKIDLNNKAQNWLQLSTYPNYTEVVRHGVETSLTNEVNTNIFLPTRLKLYLYADEYVTNEDGSTTDYTLDETKQNPINGNSSHLFIGFQKLRTLYVKIITEDIVTEGKPKKLEAIYTIQQMQGYYTGLFGGELTNGQYTEGLVVDAVNEHLMRFDDLYPVADPRDNEIYYGYSGLFTNYNWSTSNSLEENYRQFTTGAQTTYNLATNPRNYVVNTGLESIFPNMRKINGGIDLYQYDYYRNFHARFCHDLNRDKNGNGQIDYYPNDPEKNEFEWYLPSVYQAMCIQASAGSIVYESALAITGEMDATQSATSSIADIGWRASNGPKTSPKNTRCVRNIPVTDERKRGTKVTTYTEQNGDSYVMIDLSNMPRGSVDRTTTEGKDAIYETLDLYSYSTKGVLYDAANPVADASLPLYQQVRRMIKNTPRLMNAGIPNATVWAAMRSSAKFIVSPTDVYNDGDTKSNTASMILADATGKPRKNSNMMTWAEATGRLNTANSQNWNTPSQAMNTGCYAYKGKTGSDKPGSWRTPNIRELSMILVFAHDMASHTEVGFIPLVLSSTAISYTSSPYWSCSQLSSGQQDYVYIGGNIDKNYSPSIYSNGYAPGRSNRLRCIRDVN